MENTSSLHLMEINQIIKLGLASSTKDFIYLRDLKSLFEKQSFPEGLTIISTQKIVQVLNELTKRNQLHYIPYAQKNGEGDQWKFYKIDKLILSNLDEVKYSIKIIVEKISFQGFTFMNEPVKKDKQEKKKRELIHKITMLSISFSDYPFSEFEENIQLKNYLDGLPAKITGVAAEELTELRTLFHTYVISKELTKFVDNYLGPLENNWENIKLLIFNAIKQSNHLPGLQLYQNILYLPNRTYIVNNVSEYLQVVNEVSQQTTNEVFYRGQGNHLWRDVPGIYRQKEWAQNEHLLFKELILKNPVDFAQQATTFEKLTKMQHYELPTRLLDITSNPLVALYFAVSNASHDATPSEVILYSCKTTDIKFYDSDQVSVLSNLAQREKNFGFLNSTLDEFDPLESRQAKNKTIEKSLIDDFNKQGEIQYLHHTIRGEKPYFRPIIDPRHLCSSVIVKSKLDNERIKKQDGAFIIVGIGRSNCLEPAPIDFYLKNTEGDRIRIIISEQDVKGNNNAQNIRKELDRLSYNKGSLFPEIMNSAHYIKDKYLRS